MYKVFINDRPLIIDYSVNFHTPEELRAVVEKLETGQLNFAEIQISWAKFLAVIGADHQYIEAAGGLVSRSDGKLLVIERLGRWDLPKGKVEMGESAMEASRREVEEECGIKVVRVSVELPSTYHTYNQKGRKYLKRTYWYQMETAESGEGTPQFEEGITRILWCTPAEFDEKMGASYASIADWNERRKA